jgi:hypothetical protein
MEILSPVWASAAEGSAAKRRLRGLAGATVAIVDDNLDIPFTTRLEVLLTERAGATVKRLVKPSGTAPSPPALIEEAARADVAVVGIGL